MCWLKSIIVIYCCAKIKGLLYPIRDVYNEELQYVPPEKQVTFHLYDSSKPEKDEELFIGDIATIANSNFDSSLPTKFVIHGWTHGREVPWVIEMRDAMADTYLWNVIIVDWAPLSHAIYSECRTYTSIVGKQLAKFCMFVSKTMNVTIGSMHLIGHSMGAQIAAYAGFQIRINSTAILERITGLDPAAPLYEWPDVDSLDEVLDPSDAAFVDIIHTNGKHLGIIFPAGHVDYYPNGGEHQPGCGFWICSHMRSCEYWTASIRNPNLFKAYPLEYWNEYLAGQIDENMAVPMGIAAGPQTPYGTYFVVTNDQEKPYLNSTTTVLDSFILDE